MTIIWHTKKINIQRYYKLIRRTIILNSDYSTWKKFKNEWTCHVIPVDQAGEYSQFYAHLSNIEVSDGIAWGITGDHECVLFVVDTINPRILMSNAMPISHELLHAVYQENVGTWHITRKYDSPEGKIGQQGAAATVIVHDNFYGRKQTLKLWMNWGIIWIPITISYYPVKQAKKEYAI